MSVMNPAAALLALPLVWIAVAAGRQINSWIASGRSRAGIGGAAVFSAAEWSSFGLATGYVALALGVLLLGVGRLLSPLPVAGWCIALALVGAREHLAMADEIRVALKSAKLTAFGVFLALVAVAALGGCFVPPNTTEWDSLSYHLADPKLYILAHRIYYIPWESHSNFAFNMEMLYCIGLLAHSVALAKLLNFALGIAGACGVFYLSRRVVGEKAAALALVIYVTLPLVFWEAGTAYVDLAATSYAALGLLALAAYAQSGERRLAWLAGALLGGMLGIKATAAVTIALYAIGIVVYAKLGNKSVGAAVRDAAGMVAVAVLVGCAWYVKSAAYTGNPVYPFAYSIFGGRNWAAALTGPYAADQHSFGVGHGPSDLLLAPWNLTMYLLPNHTPPAQFAKPFNDYQTPLASLSPLFVFCGLAALMLPLRPRLGVRLLWSYTAAALVVWFLMTQQVRYFLPVTPVLCLLSGWTITNLSGFSPVARTAAWVSGIGAIAFNARFLVLFSSLLWQVAGSKEYQQEYLEHGLSSYSAMEFLNGNTPPVAKVISYGEPLTFYLDRGHLWGDPGHSTVVPYARLQTTAALRAWLLARGYDYVLINLSYAPVTAGPGWAGMVYGLTVGSGESPVFIDGGTQVYAIAPH